MSMPIAVLVSGSGSNLQSLIDRSEAGTLDAEIRLVLSNKAEAYGLERARRHGIPARVVDHAGHPSREAFDLELVRAITAAGAEAVILAGFMRILTPGFLNSFPGRVLNIHPALLPSFPGVHGQGDAAAYGVKLSGCTVHVVDEKMDHGPIIIQAAVPAHPDDDGDSLGKRILALEHRIYPQAVHWLATGRLAIEGRKVRLKPAPNGASGRHYGLRVSVDEVRARLGALLTQGYGGESLAGLCGVSAATLAGFAGGQGVSDGAFAALYNGLAALTGSGDDPGYLVNPPLEEGF